MMRLGVAGLLVAAALAFAPTAAADDPWHDLGLPGDAPHLVEILRAELEDLGVDPERTPQCFDVAYRVVEEPALGVLPAAEVDEDEYGNTHVYLTSGTAEVHVTVYAECLGGFGPAPQGNSLIPWP